MGQVRGPVIVPASAVVGEYCSLGYPREARLRARQQSSDAGLAAPEPVRIGERCLLFNQVIVYEGTVIGDDCVVEDRVRIGYHGQVGPRSRLMYGAYICDRVRIGAEARIAGFLCDGTIVGDRCTVMGDLVHEYCRPYEGWWDIDEEPPTIEPDTVVGYGAQVVGGVRIGPRSYVAAGAVVTKDVPPEHVVIGINVQTPASAWTGRRLQGLVDLWQRGDTTAR
jgi:acetyltransferase-like isoleucine patch superfamily enzyme